MSREHSEEHEGNKDELQVVQARLKVVEAILRAKGIK